VLEADGGRVVDEITIDTPADLDMDLSRGEIAGVRDARVLSQQRAAARHDHPPAPAGNPRYRPSAGRGPRRAAARLADLSDTPAVAVLDAADAKADGVGRQALLDPGEATLARRKEDLAFLEGAMTGGASVVTIATSVSGGHCGGRPACRPGAYVDRKRTVEGLVALHARLLGG